MSASYLIQLIVATDLLSTFMRLSYGFTWNLYVNEAYPNASLRIRRKRSISKCACKQMPLRSVKNDGFLFSLSRRYHLQRPHLTLRPNEARSHWVGLKFLFLFLSFFLKTMKKRNFFEETPTYGDLKIYLPLESIREGRGTLWLENIDLINTECLV
jgi:hypothetical protein